MTKCLKWVAEIMTPSRRKPLRNRYTMKRDKKRTARRTKDVWNYIHTDYESRLKIFVIQVVYLLPICLLDMRFLELRVIELCIWSALVFNYVYLLDRIKYFFMDIIIRCNSRSAFLGERNNRMRMRSDGTYHVTPF